MLKIVSITSQGQISIPAEIRKLLGFTAPGKVVLRVEGKKVYLEPEEDFLALEGILHDSAKTNQPIQQTIQEEKASAAEYWGSQK